VCNAPSESLAFILHDNGYDVWLGSVRGSTWGLYHRDLQRTDERFWQFTWDDMALSDLPAMCVLLHLLRRPFAIDYRPLGDY
jgi:hypothetical protein